jgi:PAS domain S-box-containing protein
MAYRKDGASVWVELITVALRDADGEITGYLGIHRDVSERKRAEEALREAQLRSETILESITDAFVAVDRDWRYTYVNDRALGRLGAWRGRTITREDVIGRDLWEVFPEAVGTEVERRLRPVMRSREPVEFEMYFAPTGEWVEARAFPSVCGLSVYYRDISARRRAEEQLREAQEQRAIDDRRLEDVREAERRRIARDLHDEALQGLTHALAVTGRHAPGADDEVHGILKQVGGRLRAAIYDLRLGQDERPFQDILLGLVELNRELLPDCEVILECEADLPGESFGRRGTEVLRITGEALTNACRHAAAERIVVRVTGDAARLSVEVTDDGRGFDPDQPQRGLHGLGLRGMRERAEHLAAELDVRSGETGTTVQLRVALRK